MEHINQEGFNKRLAKLYDNLMPPRKNWWQTLGWGNYEQRKGFPLNPKAGWWVRICLVDQVV